MIDDVQFFEKTEKTQEELFHIFNDLYDIGKQIILSSDRPIRNLRLLDDRLSSRFAAGITVDIAAPDLETRIAILEKKALSFHYLLPPEVAYYLANIDDEIEWVVLPVVSFDAYFGGTTFSKKILSKLPKDIIIRDRTSYGVSRYKVPEKLIYKELERRKIAKLRR